MRLTIELWGICTSLEPHGDKGHFTMTIEEEDGVRHSSLVHPRDASCDLVVGRHYYLKGEMFTQGIIADEVEMWGRYCDVCGKRHDEGYFLEDTLLQYACSEECLEELIKCSGKPEEEQICSWNEWYY